MAGKSDIQAGRAFVELLLKDKGFSKGLSAASARLRSFGRGATVFGAAVSAAGASIVAPLVGIATRFAQTGSALFDMMQRTNKSAAELQLLGYAAEQTGTSMAVIEKAIHKARKEGKNFEDLAGQIASIKDPAMQSQKAIELFGAKIGPQIVPLLRDLPELKKRFDELGIAMSDEDAAAADRLGDAFADLRLVGKSASDAIGAALAPAITAAISSVTTIAIRVRDWVRQNRELFVSALKIGLVVMGVGTAISALVVGAIVVGTAIGALNTMLAVGASLLSAIVSPVGLVVAGLAGLAYWFTTSTQMGQQMATSIAGWFQDLRSIAEEAFGGIVDAFAAGDLMLATDIAWAGIKAIWLEGTDSIRGKWREFAFYVIDVFNETVNGIRVMWTSLTGYISTQVVKIGGFFEKAMVGLRGIPELFKYATGMTSSDDFWASEESARKQIGMIDTVTEWAIKGIETQHKAKLDAIANERKAEIQAIHDAKTAADQASNDALDKSKAELKALREKAAEERKRREIGEGQNVDPGQFNLNAGAIKQQIFGTFSAAALMAGGGAGGGTEKQLSELRREERERHRELMRNLRGGGRLT